MHVPQATPLPHRSIAQNLTPHLTAMPQPTHPSQPDTPPPRRIAHLDMDAFFASVELLRYPQLRDLPVVIGGRQAATPEAARQLAAYAHCPADMPLHAFARLADYSGRGVITTATYAARAFGIGSAMGIMKAARLCPQAILLPASFDRYHHYAQRFKSVITRITPVMENRGIDEVYIDFTHAPDGQQLGGLVLAQRIQQAILEETGLTCSIGIAPNKLLAKIASELHKPHGICVLHAHDLQPRIWPLPCRKLNGIGPRTDERLRQHGIHTLGELAAQDPLWLMQTFGRSYGAWLHRAAWGRDDSPVITHSDPVSISRETTFERDLHPRQHRAELSAILTRLCQQLEHDLQRKGYAGKTVGIKLRYSDFSTATRSHTTDQLVIQANDIRHLARLCLRRADLSRHLRLLGVRIGSLEATSSPLSDKTHDTPVEKGIYPSQPTTSATLPVPVQADLFAPTESLHTLRNPHIS